MKETIINRNVVKKVSENGDIKYWKKVKYTMNWYYTKLSENIYEQLGAKHVKNEKNYEGSNMYLVTEDVQKDKELYLGDSISSETQLSLIKSDLIKFLTSKRDNRR
ncbi:MAG: hypothetical protein PHD15_04710 [Clostridia bacterium]|nr:hypothetical protein [Clostridia bacterium]MDD4387041.1 hypothetical protein [Clostridia bacterium]